MCTEVYFKYEDKVAGNVAELADMLGGIDKLVVYPGYGGRRALSKERDQCLCSIDIKRTFKPTEYVMTQWEDAFDWTARLPEWIVKRKQREADRARYDAAMAEMRAAQAIEARSAKTEGLGPKDESVVA